jgi:hypothetical protein
MLVGIAWEGNKGFTLSVMNFLYSLLLINNPHFVLFAVSEI